MISLSISTQTYTSINTNTHGLEFVLKTTQCKKPLDEKPLAYLYSYINPPQEYDLHAPGAILRDILTDVVYAEKPKVIVPEIVLAHFMLPEDKFFREQHHYPRLCLEDTCYLIAGLAEEVKNLKEKKLSPASLGQITIKEEKQLDALIRLTQEIYKGYKKGKSPLSSDFIFLPTGTLKP